MIADLVNRDVVLGILREVREDLEDGVDQETRDAVRGAEQREESQSSGQRGFDPPQTERRGQEPAPLDDFSFIGRDPVVSLLQSAIEKYFDVPEHADEVDEAPPADDERRGDDDEIILAARSVRRKTLPERTDDGRRIFDQVLHH
jgi:hypothetical protein